MEIAFALDTSSSVTRLGWNQTIDFVKDLVKDFVISNNYIHMGVVLFDRRVYLSFKPSDSQYWSNTAVTDKVNSIKYKYG